MKKNIYIIAAMAALFTVACGKYKTTQGGLKYRIIEKGDGEANTDTTALLFANYSISIESTDSVLRETFTKDQASYIPVFEPTMKEALNEFTKGDSAEVLINADSFFLNSLGQPRPDWIKAGDNIRFILKIKDVVNEQDMRKKQMEEIQQLGVKDSIEQKAAIAALPNAQKTPNGVYYTELKAGTGKAIKKGDKVTVLYRGSLLSGQVFDENQKDGIQVTLGLGQVIIGWEEILLSMKEGQKVRAIIPSQMAYGAQGSGPIPPFSTLVFEMEVIKIN